MKELKRHMLVTLISTEHLGNKMAGRATMTCNICLAGRGGRQASAARLSIVETQDVIWREEAEKPVSA